MKKLINDPSDVVADALRGLAAAHPDLRVDLDKRIVFRGDAPVQRKVGLVSGGGSGHEPMHGGFVGLGMLDAACAGEIFTSPVPDQVAAATRGVDGGAGVLHIVKNYTGDVMNFEMAGASAPPCSWRRSPVPRPNRAARSRRSRTSPARSTRTAAAWGWP
jgi:dihydroxyacetone kinase-like protein